jgi:arylsulfatase A-like enzyme
MSGVAFAALFSGRQAPGHGAFAHPTKLDDAVPTVTEHFGENGYEPFFWGGHKLAGPALNYAQGVPPENAFQLGLRADDVRFRQLLTQLRHRPGDRAFVVTNFSVTHSPYPPEPLGEFCAAYAGECDALQRLGPGEAEEFARLNEANMPALKHNFPETADRLMARRSTTRTPPTSDI